MTEKTASKTTSKATSKTRTPKATTAQVRAWAVKHYDGIGERGPIPAHVVADFNKSQRSGRK